VSPAKITFEKASVFADQYVGNDFHRYDSNVTNIIHI
jgi:hypothetical protein